MPPERLRDAMFDRMDKGEKPLVGRTALEDYVHEEDYSWDWTLEAESWQDVLETPKMKVKIYQVSMVSQRWSAGVKHGVSEPFWWHRLTIYRPERVRSEKAFLFIGYLPLYQT
jgi:PhoPQ-activated pathogenicity-related protein